MRIKSALSLSTIVLIVIIATIAIATSVLEHEIRKETAHLAMARNMKTAIAQRSVLGVEFYIRGEDRPLPQARLKTEQLISLLDQSLESVGEDEHARMLSERVSTNDRYIKR